MLPTNLTEQYGCVCGKECFDKKEVVVNCFKWAEKFNDENPGNYLCCKI